LYALTGEVFPSSSRRLAFITACLHILSPAGLFLSAPYAESSFSFLSFTGLLLYVRSSRSKGVTGDLGLIASGVVFGLSAQLRSNGLLNGVLFLQQVFANILRLRDGLSWSRLRRLIALGIGGICIATGFSFPQYIAYQDFCISSPRPWCEKTLPSIYTFVQDYYW
jgi:phosphatidylinositol glycan class V